MHDNIKRDLIEYVPKIRYCYEISFKHFLKHYNQYHYLDLGAKASIMHCIVTDNIRREFQNEYECIIRVIRGLFVLIVKSKYLISFKKIGDNYETCKNYTQQETLFNCQQLLLPGIDISTVDLNAGYLVNNLWSELKGIFITRPTKNRLEFWNISDVGIIKEPILPVSFNQTGSDKPSVSVKSKQRVVKDGTNG
jgi:hypothetical protein